MLGAVVLHRHPVRGPAQIRVEPAPSAVHRALRHGLGQARLVQQDPGPGLRGGLAPRIGQQQCPAQLALRAPGVGQGGGAQEHIHAFRPPQLSEQENGGHGRAAGIESRHGGPALAPELAEIAVRNLGDTLPRNPEFLDQAADRVPGVGDEVMADVVQPPEPASGARVPRGAVRPEVVHGVHDRDATPHQPQPPDVQRGDRREMQVQHVVLIDHPREADEGGKSREGEVTAFVDTNVLVRHLTGDPPHLAARATRFLAEADELLLPDLIAAEIVYVLESFYRASTDQVARAMRSIIAYPAIRVLDPALLLRAVELYEVEGFDFADAYLVANAEAAAVNQIASFDRDLDRVPSIRRIEP